MKYIVLDSHTLGCIIGNDIQILRASVIRGGSHLADPLTGTTVIPQDKTRLRPATLQDFADFMVTPPDHGLR